MSTNQKRNRSRTKRQVRSNNVKQTVLQDLSMVKVRPNSKAQRSIITPEYKISKLHFRSELNSLNSVGSTFMSKVFKLNDLYDPDPSVLTSAVAGFAELARYYYYHLVIKTTISVVTNNLESFPVKGYFGVFNEDPSTSLSSQQAVIDLAENAMCTPVREASASGGVDKFTSSLTVNLPDLVGDLSYYYGSGYYSTYYNASPSTNLILVLGYYTSGTFSQGIDLSLSIAYTVKSFCRRPILDSGPVVASFNVGKLLSELDSLLASDSPQLDRIEQVRRLLIELGVSQPANKI